MKLNQLMSRSFFGLRCRPTLLGLAAHLVAMAATGAQPGAIDPTFGVGGSALVFFDIADDFSDDGLGMALQPDGKAIMVGRIDVAVNQQDFGVARINVDGSLDLSFGLGGLTTIAFDLGQDNTDSAGGVAISPDGKIVIVGWVDSATSQDFGVVRLDASGALDSTFDGDGRATVAFDIGGANSDIGTSVALQPDGKVVVAGGAAVTGTQFSMAVARLNADGSLDTTFSTDGRTTILPTVGNSTCSRVLVQPDGAIVLVGWTGSITPLGRDFSVVRLTAAGVLDSTFDSDGRVTVDFGAGDSDDIGTGAALDSSGRIVLAGTAAAAGGREFGIARLLPSGALDTTLSGDGRATVSFGTGDDFALDVTVQPNGSIVVAGSTPGVASGDDFAIARFTANGILDPGFGNAGKTVVAFDLGQDNDDEAMALVRRPDGSGILVGGYVERFASGDTDFGFVQLHDGDLLFADGFESGNTSAWSAAVP